MKLTGVLNKASRSMIWLKSILKSIIVLWLCVVNTFFKHLLHLQSLNYKHYVSIGQCIWFPKCHVLLNASLVVDKQGKQKKDHRCQLCLLIGRVLVNTHAHLLELDGCDAWCAWPLSVSGGLVWRSI